MVMRKLLKRFAAILNLNTVAKMFTLFKRKNKFNSTLYDLELKIEAQQRQIDELRTLLLALSKDINSLQIEINYLSNNRYGKGL